MKYLMDVDNGGTFSKAAVFDLHGNQIAVASAPAKVLKDRHYQEVNAMVESVQPGESSLIYLPFLHGSDETPLARGTFVGLNGGHGRRCLKRL